MDKLGGANGPLVQRIEDLLHATEYRRVESTEDWNEVYRLRYEGYRRSFPVEKDWFGFGKDSYDDLPNTSTYSIYVAGRIAGSIRTSVLTPKSPDSPSVGHYPKDVVPRVEKGLTIVDPTRLVAHPDLARQFPELPYVMLRLPFMACEHYGADESLSCVRESHTPFYRRVLNFEVVGPGIYYKPLETRMMLMVTSYTQNRDGVLERYPFFGSSYLERRQIFGRCERVPGAVDVRRRAA